jgi:hypothetical protein
MDTILQRSRINPTWRGGLRRGTVRDTMTEYIATHPGFLEDLRRIHRQLEAWGVEPMSMEGVRQPFDYEPRRISRAQ